VYPVPDGIDTSVAHPARIWNYWLGGKDHYPADREMGDQIVAMLPSQVAIARADREFLGRVVRYLVDDMGIRQFLDIGTGLPTADNTHQVAQAIAPQSRIVYVDNDPLVLAHARALLVGSPEGATNYLQFDLREPDAILEQAARTLDFDQPVGLMLLGILEFIPDGDHPYEIVNRLLDALPSGSHLAVSHAVHSEAMDAAAQVWNDSGATLITIRSPEKIARFFDRLELLDPGVVSTPQWRPHAGTLLAGQNLESVGAVGRKR
jgi:hypothetical protein